MKVDAMFALRLAVWLMPPFPGLPLAEVKSDDQNKFKEQAILKLATVLAKEGCVGCDGGG